MKGLLLVMFFLPLTGAARAYSYDARLDTVLAADFEKTITRLPGGPGLYSRLARSGLKNSRRRLLLRRDRGPPGGRPVHPGDRADAVRPVGP